MNASSRTPEPMEWESGELARDLGFLLARSNALSLAASNIKLRECGIKIRAYSVLALVCDDLKPTQRELAVILRLDPSQVVALVDDLEGRALIERQVDLRDRRAKVLVPTAEGRAMHLRAQEAVSQAEDDTLKGLDAAERLQLSSLLRRIALSS